MGQVFGEAPRRGIRSHREKFKFCEVCENIVVFNLIYTVFDFDNYVGM